MKFTFSVLFTCWTIYSSIHAVLSLPPSLIADAASLQHQQHHDKVRREQQTASTATAMGSATANTNGLWYKDVARPSGNAERAANNEGASIVPDTIIQHTWNTDLGKNNEIRRTSRMVKKTSSALVAHFNPHLKQQQQQQQQQLQHQQQQPHKFSDAAAYDLGEFLRASKTSDEINDNTDDDTSQSIEVLPSAQLNAVHVRPPRANANEFFTPLKYWARHCQPGKNCPEQYYRALFANSLKAAPTFEHHNRLSAFNEDKNIGKMNKNSGLMMNYQVNKNENVAINDDGDVGNVDDVVGNNDNDNYNVGSEIDDSNARERKLNNDIFMFLNGENDVVKFLRWAMYSLYSNERFANYTVNGAEHYHPGMYIWKKLNLSGNLEPPLFAEEPRYVIVRRERQSDDLKMTPNYKNNDPFIPPRGRKHNMPDLDALLNRYETFVPNRGRRDKIKDMLKSDDLFFPNRGKRLKLLMPANMKRDLEYENGSFQNSNSNSQATDSDALLLLNDVDMVESKSLNDIDGYNDRNKALLPLAMVVRDVLEKLSQTKLQNQNNHNYRHHQHQYQPQLHPGHSQLKAADNKITTNAHEINYFDDKSTRSSRSSGSSKISNSNYNNKNPEWLQTMLNYKFNGYDPSVEQSMPAAVPINDETTREMSTPQKVASLTPTAARDHALQQLLKQQIHDNDNDNNNHNDDAADVVVGYKIDAFGVDRGGTKIAANRLLSTRSMSNTLAHRQQQLSQLQRQRERLQQRRQQQQQQQQKQQRLTTLSQALDINDSNEYPIWHPIENDHQQQYQHHEVKSSTNSDPLFWRQLQLLQQDPEQADRFQHLQQKDYRQRQEGFSPQETFISERTRNDNLDSPYGQAYTRAMAKSAFADNDYNYADI